MEKIKQYILKSTAVILVAAFIWLIPMEVYGATQQDASSQVELTEDTPQSEEPEAQIISELTELREESVKHFILDDGNRMAVQYEMPVHFKDKNGSWAEYDNSLKEISLLATNDEADNRELTTKQSNFDIQFSNKAKSANMVKIKTEDYQISWGYTGISESKSEVIKNNEKLTGNNQFTTLKNLTGEVIYENAFAGVDVQYFATPQGVKENLILHNADTRNEFEIEYKIKGLTATQKDSKTIELKDKNNKTVYTIDAPYMTDAKGEISTQLTLEIVTQKNNKLTVKLTADKTWLRQWGRMFPVTVDPQVTIGYNSGTTTTAFVAQSSSTTATKQQTYFYVGNTSNYGQTKALAKLNQLPELDQSDRIVSVNLNLTPVNPCAAMTIKAYPVTGAWANSSVTWNNVSYDNTTMIDYATVESGSSDTVVFDITKAAQQWYSGTLDNNGILLETASTNGFCHFGGYAYYYANQKPMFTVTYRNFKGTEPDLSYHTHPAGLNGEGSVSDYTGNLVLAQKLFEGTGSRMPVSINLTYNAFNYNKVFENGSPAGYGWQFSFNRYIRLASQELQNSGYHYIYTDEDGTDHYFKQKEDSTTEWEDEDGLGLTLTLDGSYVRITNESNTTYFYDLPQNGGKLRSETDEYINQISYTYNSEGNLTKITDGAGREYTLTYVTNSETGNKRVNKITAPDGKAITLTYWTSANNMDRVARIYYPDNTATVFSYTTAHRIAGVYSGEGGARISYTYNTAGQVSSIKEYSSNSLLGNYLNITYNTDENTTVYTDRRENSDSYTFDSRGLTTNTIKPNGYIESSSKSDSDYDVISGSDSHTLNYVGKLDEPSATSFALSGTGTISVDQSAQLVNNEKTQYLGKKSVKVTNVGDTVQYFAQARHQLSNAAPLAGKTVTFSAYVKTSEIEERKSGGSIGAILKLTAFNSSGATISETNSVGVSGTKGWQRISVTATMPAATANIRIYCSIRNAEGTAWFDGLQLEEGACMNDYNALGNSDFSASGYWNGPNNITGSPTLQKSLQQEVNVYKSNVAFNISGAVNGNSVPLSGERKFGIKLKIYYVDSSIPVEEHYQEFSPWITAQQSTCLTVKPKQPSQEIQKVVFCFVNDYNANTMIARNAMVNIGTYYGDNLVEEETESENNGEIEIGTNSYQGNVLSRDSYGNITQSTLGTVIVHENGREIIDASEKAITTQTTYNSTGNYVTSETDSRGKTTTYNVNPLNGQTNSVTSPKGNTVNYTYNNQTGNLNSITKSGSAGTSTTSYQYNEQGKLTVLNSNNVNYNFQYDTFNNEIGISIGSQDYITNQYSANNTQLVSTTYGNGDTLTIVYDDMARISSISGSNGNLVTYIYNKKSLPVKVIDSKANITTIYTYDFLGNAIKFISYSSSNQLVNEKQYNSDSSLTETTAINGQKRTVTNIWEDGQAIINNNGWQVSSNLDELSRVNQVVTSRGENTAPFTRNYTYTAGSGTNSTSEIIASVTEKYGSTQLANYGYKYDNNGNITSVTKDGATIATYNYDGLNQLVSATDYMQRTYTTYTYNVNSNITNITVKNINAGGVVTSTISSVNYTYDDTNWKDKLTSYNGQTLTYDVIGNPLTYRDGMVMTWQNGRELASITKNNNVIAYQYDVYGMRTQKNNAGTVTKYFYNDDQKLVGLEKGSVIMMFFYDTEGNINSFTYNGTKYYYIKNLQGDITAITTDKGTIVANYTYDAWGNILSITDGSGTAISNQSSVALMNPFRYRGYVFDDDTGLYYLQSRYYDSLTGRFINADNQFSLGNLYVYSNNNPVNEKDPNGKYSYTYNTTPYYEYGILEYYNIFVKIYITGETYKFVGKVTSDGVLKFDFANNNYWNIFARGGEKILAIAFFNAAKSINSSFLSGRTINGINVEIKIHYVCYALGIKTDSTRVADMGSTLNDSNAGIFEKMAFAGTALKISVYTYMQYKDLLFLFSPIF